MYSLLVKHYNHQGKSKENLLAACMMIALACICITLYVPDVFATDINSLCDVAGWSKGLGKGIATLATILLGFGAIFGKVSWPQAMTLIVGVVIFFNYDGIVGLVYGGGGCS